MHERNRFAHADEKHFYLLNRIRHPNDQE
jgi:hypothetical protein